MTNTLAAVLHASGIDTPIRASHPAGPYGEPKRHCMVYDLTVRGVAVRVTHRRASWLWLAYRGAMVYAGNVDGLCAWLAEAD